MQAIITKWLMPTDTKPSRVKATAEAGSVIVSWDHGLSQEQNHCAAARKLADKFGWFGAYYGGSIPNGPSYAWVYVDKGEFTAEGRHFFIRS